MIAGMLEVIRLPRGSIRRGGADDGEGRQVALHYDFEDRYEPLCALRKREGLEGEESR